MKPIKSCIRSTERACRRERIAHNPHHDGGSVMTWPCLAENGTGSLVFMSLLHSADGL